MKRKLLITLIILSLTIELAYVFSEFFAVGSNKIEVTNKLRDVVAADVDIKGKVELKFLPTPKLVISHIRISDFHVGKYSFNLRASKLVASVSLLKFFKGDIELGKITLSNTKLNAVLHDKAHSGSKISNILKSDISLKNFYLVDSELEIANPQNGTVKKYTDLDIHAFFSKQVEITGAFKSSLESFDLKGVIKREEGGNIRSEFNVGFSDNYLEFYTDYNEAGNITGNIKILGKDFQKFVFNNLLSLWFFYPDGRLSGYESTFNFEINDDGVSIKNGNIIGDNIEGHFIGDLKNGEVGNINVKFKYLNFDTLLTTKKKSYVIEEIAHLDLEDEAGSFPVLINNGKVLVTGTLENITIKDRNVSPINFSVFLDGGKNPRVEHLSFQITPEDFHNISGVLKKDKAKYQFQGVYESSGNDVNGFISSVFAGIKLDPDIKEEYVLKSNLDISTDTVGMSNIKATISGRSKIEGNILLDFSELRDSVVKLDASNIDFDNFFLVDDKDKKRHLLHYMYRVLSSRSVGNSLLREMLWLRNLYIGILFDLNFTDARYNDVVFDQIRMKGDMLHRVLNLENLYLNSDDNRIKVSSVINLDETRPYFNIDVVAEKADLEFLKYRDVKEYDKYKWSKDLLYVANFRNMDFSFDAKFKHLKYRELNYKNSEFILNVKDDVLDIKKAEGQIGEDGDFKVEGKIVLDGLPTISLSYILNKFPFGDYVKFLFNIPHIEATANWAGSLYSSGNTPYIMVKQLKSKNTFYLADIKVKQLAIPNIVQEIANLSIDPVNSFTMPLEDFIRDGSTQFTTAKGALNIKNGNVYIDSVELLNPNLKTVIAGKISLVDFVMKFNSVFVFTIFYKVKKAIKKTAITVTHSLEGRFDNISGKFNLFQLRSMVDELKSNYLKLYEQLSETE